MKIAEHYGVLCLIAALIGMAIIILPEVVLKAVANRFNVPAILVAIISIVMGSLSLKREQQRVFSIIGIILAVVVIFRAAILMLFIWGFSGGKFPW
jgi:hypothetical protein